MIICKYTKLDRAVYLGHLDLLKIFGMAIRRKAIPVDYSEGYNKHILMFMSQPLSLGLASECEYFCIQSPCDPADFLNRINSSLPDGIRLLNAEYIKDNPNISALMKAAKYEVEIVEKSFTEEKLEKLKAMRNIEIEIKTKTFQGIKDVKPLVYSVSLADDRLQFVLSCGNINLKANKFVEWLTETMNLKSRGYITKKQLYTELNGELVDVDEYLHMKKTYNK